MIKPIGRQEDQLWLRWLDIAGQDFDNPARRCMSSPKILRQIVDEQTKPLHAEIERLKLLNKELRQEIQETVRDARDAMTEAVARERSMDEGGGW